MLMDSTLLTSVHLDLWLAASAAEFGGAPHYAQRCVLQSANIWRFGHEGWHSIAIN
jgi:hypothetical protein